MTIGECFVGHPVVKVCQNIETNYSIYVSELLCNKIKNLDNLILKNRMHKISMNKCIMI